MTKKINVVFISDVVCPWCLLAYKRLNQAIDALKLQDRVEIDWQTFLLNPDIPTEGENIYDYGLRKYGRRKAEWQANRAHITELGKTLGFTFDFNENSRVYNTFDAHIMLNNIDDFSQKTAFKNRLFNAFFTENKDISNRVVLTKLLDEINLEIPNLVELFDDPSERNKIKKRAEYWHKMGVSSVPMIFFNQQNAISGCREIADYQQILREYS